MLRFDVLNKLPRTGFLMRGIDPPESIGEHIFSSVVLAVLLLEEFKKDGTAVDGEKLLKMAALHESGEILTGDIPAPATKLIGRERKSEIELEAGKKVLQGFPGLHSVIEEFEKGETDEAKIVRSIDKIQMMVKVLLYESEGRGNMNDFWAWEGNFVHCGIKAVDDLVDGVRSARGHKGLDLLEVTVEDAVSE